MQSRQQNNSPLNVIMGVFTLVAILVGLYYLAKIMIWLLGIMMPVFIIGTLIIDHKVMLNYGKLLIKWTKNNPIMGIIAIILSIVGMPLLAPFFFGKAMLNRKVRTMQDEAEGRTGRRDRDDFISYEELPMETETETKSDDSILDLHNDPAPNPLDKSKRKSSYDELFEDLDIDEERPTKLW